MCGKYSGEIDDDEIIHASECFKNFTEPKFTGSYVHEITLEMSSKEKTFKALHAEPISTDFFDQIIFELSDKTNTPLGINNLTNNSKMIVMLGKLLGEF